MKSRMAPMAALFLLLAAAATTRNPRAQGPHQPGAVCSDCHAGYRIGGTVFTDRTGTRGRHDVPVSIVAPDGIETPLGMTDASGNLAAATVPSGPFLIRTGPLLSRTWHGFPEKGMCNACHQLGGNVSGVRSTVFPELHTRLPADNSCTHCHHFPAARGYAELATEGVLVAAPRPPLPPASQVEILRRIYTFDPAAHAIQTVRPDVFAPGYFSMFDVILAVARANGISVDYEYDESRKTHFIRQINGAQAEYWYHFSYDTGGGNGNEIQVRRANRWDELLWRPGAWIQVVTGEDLDEIKREYLEEIAREKAQGNVIPAVQIQIAAQAFRGNPAGSGRLSIQRNLRDVRVTAHDTRAAGSRSPGSKPFQPGVVTALDLLLSLQDQGQLDLVTTAFYSHFARNHIDSQYVIALGFPGAGTAHASGRQGFIYTTENGTPNRLPNNADSKLHVTSDILVIHAPDFSAWRWRELGQPYYEAREPAAELPGVRLGIPLPAPDLADLQVGLALVNEGAAASALRWEARSEAGEPAGVAAPGANPVRTVIGAGRQWARLAGQLFGAPLTGGAWLEALSDDPTVSAFYLLFDPALEVVDGCSPPARGSTRFILPENPPGQETEIILINPDETRTADVTVRFLADGGAQQGTPVAAHIPPRGRWRGRVRDLFPSALTVTGGYMEAVVSIPVVGLQQFGIAGVHTSALNALDLDGGARLLVAPQFAFGGGYRSAASIVNLEDAATRITVSWIRSDGGEIGRAQADLSPRGRMGISDPTAFGVSEGSSIVEGYLSVTSSATRVAGSVRFGDPAGTGFQTALPMESEGRLTSLFAQLAQDAVWYTGLAAVNAGSRPAQVVVEAFDPSGARLGAGAESLQAGARFAKVLPQLVPDLPALGAGYFRVRSNRPIHCFAVFGTQRFSSLAAIAPR